MDKRKKAGKWVPHDGPLPRGVLRGWNAEGGNRIWAGIFETFGNGVNSGSFVLVYHRVMHQKPTIERFPGLQLALERGSAVLNAGGVIGRPRGSTDPEFYRKNVPGVQLAN